MGWRPLIGLMECMNFVCYTNTCLKEASICQGPQGSCILTTITTVSYMIASCLLSDRHFLDALPMLFIILRLVLRSRHQRISNTFSCRWENIWLSLSINDPIQQQIWRWMAKDSFSNSIMLPRALQALSSNSSHHFQHTGFILVTDTAWIQDGCQFSRHHAHQWPPQVGKKEQIPVSSWGSDLRISLLLL